ncbi:MAG: sirohydrochlorin chelatase [Rhodobacteraceae bacterium]|nr:sirohydrochlorin chelatase [Paracoccaceae bacterium]
MSKIGVMLCGHGSRSGAAVEEFAALARALAARLPDWPVEHGYLEFANPVIRSGLDALRERGCDHILAVPGMLFAAMHAKNDIPSVLNAYAQETGVTIQYGRELGVDPKMIRAAGDRISEALDSAGPVPVEETCLVVIGRGASDPDANANISKVARLLWEGFGFGWCEVGYSGVTFPLVAPCLDHVSRLGYRRVVVFPYFLFSGILIDRIYGFTDLAAKRHEGIEFIKAGYLSDHPQVVETFAERVTEILDGDTAMNCSMCKYRTQVLGFEAEVGLPQESHHHHVEGQGASAPGSNVSDCPLCGDFCTGACRLQIHHHHDHDHHHPHYPHAAHPHGPESVRQRDGSRK